MFPLALFSWNYGSVTTEAQKMSINPFGPYNTIDSKSLQFKWLLATAMGLGKTCVCCSDQLTTERAGI